MKRLARKAILWLTLLAGWAGLCAAPSWAMTAFAFVVGFASLLVLPYLFQSKRKTRSA